MCIALVVVLGIIKHFLYSSSPEITGSIIHFNRTCLPTKKIPAVSRMHTNALTVVSEASDRTNSLGW